MTVDIRWREQEQRWRLRRRRWRARPRPGGPPPRHCQCQQCFKPSAWHAVGGTVADQHGLAGCPEVPPRRQTTNSSKLCTNRAFLFFRTQPAAGSYPQFCLLPPVHAAASLRMLATSAGFPLQNIDAQRQQGRQPWGQPTEGLCTPRRAGSVCRAHPPPAGLCAGRRAGNPSRFMYVHQGSCRVSGVCWRHLPP